MSKKYLFLIFLILIIIVIVMLTNDSPGHSKACINSNCFNIEIAESSEERSKGLMYRESLDSNSGMLFIFDQEKEYSIWMKNTLIPLDIIWINKDLEIVHIEKNVQPCKENPCIIYKPDKPAKYVLELNADQTEKTGIEIGSKLIFK